MSPEEAIEAAAAIEAETRYRSQLARESYEAGHADGYHAGYEAAWGDREADAAAWWREHGGALVDGPTHAELEARRWGPGGREAFASPRPGDFPGRETTRAQARPEADREMEASA